MTVENQIGIDKLGYSTRELLLLKTKEGIVAQDTFKSLEQKRYVYVNYKYKNRLIKLGKFEISIEEMKIINDQFRVLIDLIDS